jgi:hypothetical protein
MHFWLVLACHSYCLAYFPHAYRVFYFVLVIIIDVTYSLSELLGMCYHVYSLTPPKCVVVCTLYLLYSKVSVQMRNSADSGGVGGRGFRRKQTGTCDNNTGGAGQHAC